jgi:hypothetical protein
MAPGRHFSSQGEPRRARGTLRTAVAATVVAASSALTILSASLDQASAQAVPGAVSSPPADQLVLRFTPPPGTSVRQHYINATVFRRLLGRFATTASVVRVCNLIVLSGDRFDAIRPTVKPPRPDQRPNCLRQAVHFALQGAMGEAEFVLARQEEARFIARWTHPPARYPRDAVFASERLGYRVIYHDKSPLNELNAITSEDYTNLRFADFIQWVNVSRRDGLMTFDGDPAMLDALDLKPAGQWDPISLSSAFVPPDVLFYDGERFGVPAMIMIRISAKDFRLQNSEVWRRFYCNQPLSAPPALLASGPISNITCFSHREFGVDHWLGLAIRKTADADATGFCVAVKEFANRPDLASLAREASPETPRPYVLLPESCRTTTSSP